MDWLTDGRHRIMSQLRQSQEKQNYAHQKLLSTGGKHTYEQYYNGTNFKLSLTLMSLVFSSKNSQTKLLNKKVKNALVVNKAKSESKE